jgi:hypothetical protein
MADVSPALTGVSPEAPTTPPHATPIANDTNGNGNGTNTTTHPPFQKHKNSYPPAFPPPGARGRLRNPRGPSPRVPSADEAMSERRCASRTLCQASANPIHAMAAAPRPFASRKPEATAEEDINPHGRSPSAVKVSPMHALSSLMPLV